ncbi:hypothetical protein A9B99_22025 [Mangrovibacter phragmitis]|uniref:AP2/ERF domain-containing protein n=2 Tax=Mangrovibacter phragmitis TaxID=1691903 RepID=A0A1B7L503_9ENTR|nr:hypothetical protein A9B99_22025 [Mangrovibacter phragmitis]
MEDTVMEKINDLKGNKGKYHKEALRAWHNIHHRVLNCPSYTNVLICEEWYTYSNFYKWFSNNYVAGWDIDKDIKGGNEYSPSNCLFVPKEVNLLFRNVDTRYDKGVVRNGEGFQAQITIDRKNEKLGTYQTIEQAHAAYEVARTERLKKLSLQYPSLSNII